CGSTYSPRTLSAAWRSASASITSREAQKSLPSARPRSRRWKPCEWALTNPGSARRRVSAAFTGDYPKVTMAAHTAPLPVLAKLPNALTIARFALIPVFIRLLAQAEGGHSWAAGIVFGVAAITDQVDGWLARRWHVESEFGKYADPLADRLVIDAAGPLLVRAGPAARVA